MKMREKQDINEEDTSIVAASWWRRSTSKSRWVTFRAWWRRSTSKSRWVTLRAWWRRPTSKSRRVTLRVVSDDIDSLTRGVHSYT